MTFDSRHHRKGINPAYAGYALISLLTSVGCSDFAGSAQTRAPQFHLPFAAGQGASLLQVNNSGWTHVGRDRYAWDFQMSEGTPVAAAASGVVVEVVDRHGNGGIDVRFTHRVNRVVLDHGNGLFSIYEHLQRAAVTVKEGQAVLRGEILARSGNSGRSSGPHLHFEVTDYRNRSVPIRFVEAGNAELEVGEVVVSENAAPEAPAAEGATYSHLPVDAFAANGILLRESGPIRLLSAQQPLILSGKVTRPAERVVAFVLQREDDESIRHADARIDDANEFRVNMDLAGLDGPFDFALALVLDDSGHFESEFSVPVVIRRSIQQLAHVHAHDLVTLDIEPDVESARKVETP